MHSVKQAYCGFGLSYAHVVDSSHLYSRWLLFELNLSPHVGGYRESIECPPSSCTQHSASGMDEGQAARMQMQLRHNAEDLQSYLRELDSWEEEMRRKDESLRKEKPILKEVLSLGPGYLHIIASMQYRPLDCMQPFRLRYVTTPWRDRYHANLVSGVVQKQSPCGRTKQSKV